MELKDKLEESAKVILDALGGFAPEIGIILGSGWGPVADAVEQPMRIPFSDVPYLKSSTATGHVGQFVFGMLGGKRVCVMQGRLHGYEGYTAQEVAYPVWLMNRLGAHTVIATNAAGALNPEYHVGDYCLMADQMNFTGRNPLDSVEADHLAFRFVSMLDAFDPALRAIVRQVAAEQGVSLQEGVYLALLGPSFETPAEIRAFQKLGADTVAMSVAEEVIAARHVGMRVIGISLVSNMGCGIEGANPSDDEVFEVAKAQEATSAGFIEGIVAAI